MLLQPNPYSLPLFTAALIALLVAAAAWYRQSAPGARPLALLMLGLCFWAGGYAAQWSATALPMLGFWQNFTYVGVSVVPTAFLAFALQYTRRRARLGRRLLALLALEPLLSLVLFWSSDLHHLYHTGFSIDSTSTPFVQIDWGRGPWFWANMAYSYALIALGVGLLARHALRKPSQQTQANLVLAGALVPIAANIYNEFMLRVPLEVDVTPLSFLVSGIIFSYALSRFNLLELGPVARHLLVEKMSDGLLVLDGDNRIADLNPAARRMAGIREKDPSGRPAASLLANQSGLVERFLQVNEAEAEVETGPGEWLDLRITPIRDRRTRQTGRMVVFRDISQRKRIEQELQEANEELRAQVEQVNALRAQLEEQAVRDPLTGLFNRRYLDGTLERALAQARRGGYPLAVVMLDIDHFKGLNDTHGHQAGDLMLQALANRLKGALRFEDILCRYGGEEFLLALPGMDSGAACRRAEEWRLMCAGVCLSFERVELRVTVSAGVAVFPEHGASQPELTRAADRALYQAKAAGRNRVVLWDASPAE